MMTTGRSKDSTHDGLPVRIAGYAVVPGAVLVAFVVAMSITTGAPQAVTSAVVTSVPVVMQQTPTDCGVAAFATLAALRGVTVSPYEDLLRRYGGGPQTMESVRRMAADVGLRLEAVRVSATGLNTLALPAILHLRSSHFVVLVDRNMSFWTIADPGAGLRRLRPMVVASMASGAALMLHKMPVDPGKGDTP